MQNLQQHSSNKELVVVSVTKYVLYPWSTVKLNRLIFEWGMVINCFFCANGLTSVC